LTQDVYSPEPGASQARSGGDRAPGPVVRVRYFAGARAAAGTAEESIQLPAGSTVHDAVTAMASRHGEGLSRVLAASSFLVDGVAVRDRSVVLPDGAGLDVLPPFAGG
jgi:molybdopterin synthase sulfur carrier subunit